VGGTAATAAAAAAAALRAPVVAPQHHVYLKTAYVPVTRPYHGVLPKAIIDPLLRRLVPVEAVQRIVAETMPADIHAAVGVHVRSRSVDRDNVDVDRDCEYTTDGAATTDFWRQQSQVPVFLDKMNRYLARNPAIHFFVATDDFRTIELLEAEFPGRIAHIARDCDDRRPACVQYALADMMCLGRTRKIIGSNWSSFSEVSGRLSGAPLFLSGISFGKKPRRRVFQAVTRWRKVAVSFLRALFVREPDLFSKCKNLSAVATNARRRRS
jgi:hypothetical protein